MSTDSLKSLFSLCNTIFDEDISLSDIDSNQDFLENLNEYLLSDIESVDESDGPASNSNFDGYSNVEEKIFMGSQLSVKQFSFTFLFLVHKMKLPRNQRDNLFRFFKYVLPENNQLPSSYASIVKNYLKDSITPTITKMCSFCENELNSASCINENCSKPLTVPRGVKTSYETIIFDAEAQIKDILERNWNEIEEYKSKSFI
jgi:hypothetical protein